MLRVRAFVRLSRFKFLAGGILAFALGAVVARFQGATLTPVAYLQGQLTVTAFHLMVHYSNDYFDRFCDAETERTPWSGGSGALLDGILSPRVALVAALLCALAGVLGAGTFAAQGNIAVAAVTLTAGLCGWFYSAPPLRLLARGLGELDTAVLIALLFPLAGYWTFAHGSPTLALASALPSLAAMMVLMFCVEYPDVEADRATGKMNLVARLGRISARYLVFAAVAAIYVGGAAAIALGAPGYLAYFLALTLPISWGLCAPLAAGNALDADVAARGVSLFVVTALGSTLAYVAAL